MLESLRCECEMRVWCLVWQTRRRRRKRLLKDASHGALAADVEIGRWVQWLGQWIQAGSSDSGAPR